MKYTKEITDKILDMYSKGATVPEICTYIQDVHAETVPERSVIAKLSSLGVYQKKQYLTKRGELPQKKSELIERIAVLLDCNQDLLESLEKVNKSVLLLIETRLQEPAAAAASVEPNLWADTSKYSVAYTLP